MIEFNQSIIHSRLDIHTCTDTDTDGRCYDKKRTADLSWAHRRGARDTPMRVMQQRRRLADIISPRSLARPPPPPQLFCSLSLPPSLSPHHLSSLFISIHCAFAIQAIACHQKTLCSLSLLLIPTSTRPFSRLLIVASHRIASHRIASSHPSSYHSDLNCNRIADITLTPS